MCSIVNITLSAILESWTQITLPQRHSLLLTIVNNP